VKPTKLLDNWYELKSATGHKCGFRMIARKDWHLYFRGPKGEHTQLDDWAPSRIEAERIAREYVAAH
jgi:hypothetical protein